MLKAQVLLSPRDNHTYFLKCLSLKMGETEASDIETVSCVGGKKKKKIILKLILRVPEAWWWLVTAQQCQGTY